MLKPAVIPLTGGLDFSNTKTLVEAGKLTDCLNYDTDATFGYGRINGFFRWDGASDISDGNLFAIKLLAASDLQAEAALGSPLYVVDHHSGVSTNSALSDSFGIVIGYHNTADTSTYWVIFAYTDKNKAPSLGDSINVYTTAGVPSPVISASVCQSNPIPIDNVPEMDVSTSNLASYILSLFNDSGSFSSHYYPGSGQWAPKWLATFETDDGGVASARGSGTAFMVNLPIVGAHYQDDKALCVTNLLQMTVSHLNTQVYPGDVVYPTGGFATPPTYYRIINTTLVEGTWTGGTVDDKAVLTLFPLYKRTADISNPGERNRSPDVIALQSTSIVWALLRGGNSNCFRLQAVAEEGVGNPVNPEYTVANLRRSYSEQQARLSGGVATLSSSSVGPTLTVTNGGSGYTSPPRLEIVGTGFGATAVAKISAGAITEAVLINPGFGYTENPTITVSGGGGTSGAVSVSGRWEQQEAGWQYIDHGWLIPFDAGTSASGYLTKIDRSKLGTNQSTTFTASSTSVTGTKGTPNTILQTLDFDTAVQQGTFGWASSVSDGSMPGSLVQTEDDTNYVSMYLRDSAMNYSAYIPTIGFVDFKTVMNELPQNATIRGIEVIVAYDTTAGFGSTDVPRFRLKATLFKTSNINASPSSRTETRIGSSKELDLTVSTSATNDATKTFGADGDLWGALDLNYNTIKDSGFGVALDLLVTRGASTTCDLNFRIDKVQLKIHYNEPSVRYYFSDGAGNTLAGDLVDYIITKGDLKRGDCEGIMQIANLHPIAMTNSTATSSMTVKDNYAIYSKSDLSAGTKVGDVSADMTYNGLPSRRKIHDANSRYELVSANFYANADWESVFGVSGAGRAFEYDGKYFKTIYAINPGDENAEEKDLPRHIAKHKYRLALGYSSGSILLSSQVSPSDFSGLNGAAEVGVGGRITGLSALAGSYLAAFCQNSIYGIAEDGLDLRVISASSGCIEYSLANVGNAPIFCDTQGISTLEASDKYGDFVKRPLSSSIYPWLLPRLKKSDNPYLGGAGSGLVVAYPIRSKSQYIMWFADGTQLVLGLSGGWENPQFTITKYILPLYYSPTSTSKLDVLGVVRPLALTSQMSDDGEEHVLFSIDLWNIGTPSSTFSKIDYANYLYRANHLWFFDCGVGVAGIPAHIQTQYWNKEDPFKVSTIRKVRLEGSSRKYAPLTITTGIDFDDASGEGQDVSLHETTETGLPISPVARSRIANVKETARTSAIKIASVAVDSIAPVFEYTVIGSNGEDTMYSPNPPSPEHHLQTLLLKYEEGRDDA